MNSEFQMPKLHHREPGEIVYDDSFELDGQTFYIVYPPSENVFQRGVSLLLAHSQEEGAGEEFLFDGIIGAFVVAWDIPNQGDGGGIWPCNEANKKELNIHVKVDIAKILIERINLWLMTT